MTVYGVRVGKSKLAGRGVFTTKPFRRGQIIMREPVVVMRDTDVRHLNKTILAHYCFQWGERWEKICIALGYGSLINHSKNPNCDWEPELKSDTLVWRALQPIARGQELYFNYNAPGHDEPLWFTVKS